MARSAAISRCDQWIATIHEAQRSPSSSGRQPVPSTTHRRSSWRKEHSARVCADSCSGAVRDGRCRAIAMPRSGSRGLHLLLGRDAYLAIRAPTPSLRGKKGRHRPRNATSRAWQCLRSYGFSDRERDENCALAIAWKHASDPTLPALEIAATAALSLARERFAEKRASGSRPRRVVRRSCFRPNPSVRSGPSRRPLSCSWRSTARYRVATVAAGASTTWS